MVRAAISRIHPHDLWRSCHRLRGGRRLTQTATARSLDISQAHLSAIYSGKHKPSRDVIRRMAALANGGCPASEIISWHALNPPFWERTNGSKRRKKRGKNPPGTIGLSFKS